MPGTRTSRRLVSLFAAVLTPTLLLGAAGSAPEPPAGAVIKLYQSGVAIGPDHSVFMIPTGSGARYLPESRVLDPASIDPAILPRRGADLQAHILRQIRADPIDPQALMDPNRAAALADESRQWLASGTIPGAEGPMADLGTSALLDLQAMTQKGRPYAGPSRSWRYVWPRDASFVAVAFARTGHTTEALEILLFLQGQQSADGSFHARYRTNGQGPPDDRGIQDDGAGWVLWALDALIAETSPNERAEITSALHRLLERTTGRLLALTDDGHSLPPPSSDYWETDATVLTLGTAAPILAGLSAASRICADHHAAACDSDQAHTTTEAATRLRASIEREFGDDGYARQIHGGERDAAVMFTLPPYQNVALSRAEAAWRDGVTTMVRPAGGIAPGEGWHQDGVSWTPQTALYALAAASTGNQHDLYSARRVLLWLDEHRTDMGALPEKVLADGSPAAVAPLTWTSALVVLALLELDQADAWS